MSFWALQRYGEDELQDELTGSDPSKSLLSSGVPDLHYDFFIVKEYALRHKVDPNNRPTWQEERPMSAL